MCDRQRLGKRQIQDKMRLASLSSSFILNIAIYLGTILSVTLFAYVVLLFDCQALDK